MSLPVQLRPGSRLRSPVGKRFTHPDDPTLEVLVTKGGDGTRADGTTALVLREAKQLPSSD